MNLNSIVVKCDITWFPIAGQRNQSCVLQIAQHIEDILIFRIILGYKIKLIYNLTGNFSLFLGFFQNFQQRWVRMLHWSYFGVLLNKTRYYVICKHFSTVLVIVILYSLVNFVQSTNIWIKVAYLFWEEGNCLTWDEISYIRVFMVYNFCYLRRIIAGKNDIFEFPSWLNFSIKLNSKINHIRYQN